MENKRFLAIVGENPDELEFGYDEDYFLCAQMKYQLAFAIKEATACGFTAFASTVEQGVAMWGAEICDAVKQLGGDITFTALPLSEEQASKWHPERRERYFAILERADDIVEPEGENFGYDYMFAHSDGLLVLGSPVHERISDLISKAKKLGIPVRMCGVM